MAAASSQSARDRNGSLLARATCPWWRTRARTRSLICLPAKCVSVGPIERDTQSCSFRTKSIRVWHAPLSIVGSFECSVKRTFFSFFRCMCKVIRREGKSRILNAAGGGSRDLERDFRLQVWSNLKGFAVALFDFRSVVRKRIFEDFFSIVEESLLFVFNIYTCVYIGTWDVVIYWYLNIVEIIIVYMVI